MGEELDLDLTTQEEIALTSYVHTPLEAQAAFVALGKKIYGTTGISAGSPMLDQFIFLNRPGWVRTWLGRPGEGKSTIMRILAMTEARRLVEENLTDKYYVAFVSYEESIDSQEIHFRDRIYKTEDFWRGTVKPEYVIRSSINRPNIPIYWFGESMMKSNINSPPMTIDMCISGIMGVFKNEGKKPSLIIIDYAQEVEVERKGRKRTDDVIAGMRDILKLAEHIGCPVELGSQAKQTSKDRSPPIPELDDNEYSYFLAQKSQNVVGIWRCWVTEKDKTHVQNNGVKLPGWREPFDLVPNLTVLRPNKSRYSMMKMAVPVLVEVEEMRIKDLDSARRQLQQ